MMSFNEETRKSSFHKIIPTLWQQFSEIAKRELNLLCPPCPEKFIFKRTGKKIGRIENGVLIINQKISNVSELCEVISWICISEALKKIIPCEKYVFELAKELVPIFYSKQSGGSSLRFLAKENNFSPTFKKLELLAGKNAILEVASEIIDIATKGLFEKAEYATILEHAVNQIVPELNENECTVLEKLPFKANMTLKKLSKILSRSTKWCSKVINALKTKGIISFVNNIRFESIGYRKFLLFIGVLKQEQQEKILEILKSCPFIKSIELVLIGPWSIIAQLSLPGAKGNLKIIYNFADKIQDFFDVSVKTLDIALEGKTSSFQFYDLDSKNWSLPWELLESYLAKIHDEKLAFAIPSIFRKYPDVRRELEPLDLRILNLVLQGVVGIDNIRKTLHAGQRKVAQRVKWLRSVQVLEQYYKLGYVGLPETALIYTDDPDAAKSIIGWANILPYYYVAKDVNERYFVRIRLPAGSGFSFSKTLSKGPKSYYLAFSKIHFFKNEMIPISDWNTQTRSWNENSLAKNWLENNLNFESE